MGCAALLQGSDIVRCSVVKLAVVGWLVALLRVHMLFWGKRFHYTGCGDLLWLSDKGRMGPWDPNHADSPNRPHTMDSPKIETTGSNAKFKQTIKTNAKQKTTHLNV